jgi:hypothetical protein
MTEIIDENLKKDPTVKAVTTRSAGIRYGIISGVIGIAYFVIMNVSGVDMNQGFWRWASLIYIITLLFLAQKYYKDNGNGYMSFGEGMGITFWLALISSILSSVFSYIYWKLIDSSMIQMAIDQARQKMEEDGKMSEEQIDQAMNMSSKFMTPETFLIFGLIFGIIIILIVGLIITIFTQKRNPETVYN